MRRLLLFSLVLVAACNSPEKDTDNTPADNTATNRVVPAPIPYEIVNIYPHDTKAFTEGLEFYNGVLYESCGEYGTSDLRKTDWKTGAVLQRQPMGKQYFGEGLTIMHGKIYQLTYKEHIGFVYDLKTFKQIQTFTIPAAEGWGMTHDSTHIIFDDGTNLLHYLDPETLKEVKQVAVSDESGPLPNLNELEYIKGYIYANIWRTEIIVKIDPSSGQVVGRADLNDLRAKVGVPPMSDRDPKAPEVMNGIAYDSASNRILITGKFWPKMVEIKLDN
jgi:glutamine cyclotransferase